MLTMLGSWRRFLALALVGVLTASLGAVMTESANAASTAPVEIRLKSITSITAPVGTPDKAVPTVLALATGELPADAALLPGMELTLTVNFFDSEGHSAYFRKDTRLVVTSDRGTVTNIDTVALKGKYESELKVSIPAPANQVRLTVKDPGGKLVFFETAGDKRFDVLSKLRRVDPTDNFAEGIGGEGNCARATPEAPVCGIVILPTKASSSQVLLSLGPCVHNDAIDYTGCGDSPRGSVVQTLVGLDGYSRTSPATILVKCDKTLCGGGSIHSKILNFTQGGNTALTEAKPCAAKGTVGPLPQVACVDYVQSKRDGSGDTYLYLLFVKDARVSVG